MKVSEVAVAARNRLQEAQKLKEPQIDTAEDLSQIKLPAVDASTAQLDVDILLEYVTGRTRSALYAWPDATLTATELGAFDALIDKRLDGYPVAYLIGRQEFWSLPFCVTPDVLIPRPETELLVETALEFLEPLSEQRVLELGTGSGAIAIALATELTQARIIATDVSSEALAIARHNAGTISSKVNRRLYIDFVLSDWFEFLEKRVEETFDSTLQTKQKTNNSIPSEQTSVAATFDLIISNPPYLAEHDPHLEQSIRFEPLDALVSGDQGLDSLMRIASGATSYLSNNGLLALEHGFDQADAVRGLLVDSGYTCINTHRDLAGLERVTTGSWAASSTIKST